MNYVIKKSATIGYYVQRTDDGKVVAYGSKRECEQWLEKQTNDQ